MGTPIICENCGEKNGLLAENCRCGHIISRNGLSSHKHGDRWLPAKWETIYIPDIWRAVHNQNREELSKYFNITVEKFIEKLDNPPGGDQLEDIPIDAHKFLKYVNMLNNMQLQFDIDDEKHWFNECIFFLRGGYEFYKHLHSTANIQNRANIFGGLNHAVRPGDRLSEWIKKVIMEAYERNMARIDILVVDEITSGSGVKRICKVIKKALNTENYQKKLDITFSFYLASGGTDKYEDNYAKNSLRDIRRYKAGEIIVTNEFIIFDGPVYTYDSSEFSGLNALGNKGQYEERYAPVVFRPWSIVLHCPDSRKKIYTIVPGNNDLNSWMGDEIISWLKPEGMENYYKMAHNSFTSCCNTCEVLFERLRNPIISNYNLFGAEFDECVGTRAYYLWMNKSDKKWEDDIHNWLKAERQEKSRKR